MQPTGFNYTVPWSKFRKLKQRPAGNTGDAETVSGYNSKNIKLARKGNGHAVVSAEVAISMDTRSSWVVTGKMSAYLLKHEQGHYDITALAAREFYQEVLKVAGPDSKGVDDAIKKLNDGLQIAVNDANIRYDAQTNHSRDKQQQQKWDQRIAAEKQKPGGKIINLP